MATAMAVDASVEIGAREPGGAPRLGWQGAVPRLVNGAATLREISIGDATALLAHLADPVALRHVAPAQLRFMAHAFAARPA